MHPHKLDPYEHTLTPRDPLIPSFHDALALRRSSRAPRVRSREACRVRARSRPGDSSEGVVSPALVIAAVMRGLVAEPSRGAAALRAARDAPLSARVSAHHNWMCWVCMCVMMCCSDLCMLSPYTYLAPLSMLPRTPLDRMTRRQHRRPGLSQPLPTRRRTTRQPRPQSQARLCLAASPCPGG